MIHAYKLCGCNIVLDVCSGSVHVVDDAAFDMIRRFETEEKESLIRRLASPYRDDPDVTEEELRECCGEIEALRDDGKLFSPDTFEPMAGELKQRTSGVVKALCLRAHMQSQLQLLFREPGQRSR